MPIKQPLYPHVPKIKAKGGGRIDYDKILSALDYFIKDEQKAAKEYRDFVDRLHSTIVLRHWAGRNSRGVTQFEGKTINDLIVTPESVIDERESVDFLKKIIAL